MYKSIFTLTNHRQMINPTIKKCYNGINSTIIKRYNLSSNGVVTTPETMKLIINYYKHYSEVNISNGAVSGSCSTFFQRFLKIFIYEYIYSVIFILLKLILNLYKLYTLK